MTFRPVHWLERAFLGHQFAAFLISVLAFAALLLGVMAVIPVSDTPFGAFVADFKMWCYGWDPSTQTMDWSYVAVMVLNPLMLIGIVWAVWSAPLGEAARERPTSLVSTGFAGLVVVAALSAGLIALGPAEAPDEELPFPAERLRTSIDPPDLALWNQDGDMVRLRDLRGRVVLVTAVYATCHTACPTIITHLKRTVEKLPPTVRAKLTVVAITLDPKNDTQERLANTARVHQISAPLFNLVNGDDPEVVEDLLDAFSVSRSRNPETGMIDHANMFILIDGEQKIAYRLTLGDRHQNWLETALRVLLREV